MRLLIAILALALAAAAPARAAAQGALAAFEQVGNAHWANEARFFIAELRAE